MRMWGPVGVVDGEDVIEGDPGGLPFLLLVITVGRFGRAAALPCSFGQAREGRAVGRGGTGVDGRRGWGRGRAAGGGGGGGGWRRWGGLGGWGHGRARVIRAESGPLPVRPRRAACRGCRATHVLLPVEVLLRRADGVEVVGAAIAAKATGLGARPVAALLDRPLGTVRGWRR